MIRPPKTVDGVDTNLPNPIKTRGGHYTRSPNDLWRKNALTPIEKAVLAILYSHLFDHNWVIISKKTIAEEVGCGERIVSKALDYLKFINVISWQTTQQGNGWVNCYVVKELSPLTLCEDRHEEFNKVVQNK